MTDEAKGRCPECDRRLRLNKDGTLRHHAGAYGTGDRPGWPRAYRCKGAGMLPSEQSEDR